MWHKAMLMEDYATAAKILRARTPSEQKALGRRVEGFIQELWDESLPGVLDAILWAKYRKPTRRDALMDTGTQGIVEASNDVVYGCGLASNGEVPPRSEWTGRNELGKALERVRERIRVEQAEELGGMGDALQRMYEEDEELEMLEEETALEEQQLQGMLTGGRLEKDARLEDIPLGTVWDEARPDGKQWFLVRVASDEGHLFAWLHASETNAQAVQVYRQWAGSQAMVHMEDMSSEIRCANVDFDVTAGTRTRLRGLALPAGEVGEQAPQGEFTVREILARERAGGGYKVLVQYAVGEATWEQRSKWVGTHLLQEYEATNPLVQPTEESPAGGRKVGRVSYAREQRTPRQRENVDEAAPEAYDALASRVVNTAGTNERESGGCARTVRGRGGHGTGEHAQPDTMSDGLEERMRRMMDDEAAKREEMERKSTASMAMLTAQLNTMMGLLGDVRRQDQRPDRDEAASRAIGSNRQPNRYDEVGRTPHSDDDLRSVGSMYEERPTVLSAGAAGAFMDESLQARLETRTAREEVRNASNEALSLLLTTSKRKAQANLFANFTTGQQEHLYLLQKLGVPMADLKPRLHISMVAALRGWNRQLQYVGVALGLTEPAYKFARTNHSVYGSATRDAEYKSVTKHVVGHEFESQTLMGLEVPGTVKRTLPENPAGGWNKIGTCDHFLPNRS